MAEGIKGCGGVLKGNRVFWLPIVSLVLLLGLMNISNSDSEIEITAVVEKTASKPIEKPTVSIPQPTKLLHHPKEATESRDAFSYKDFPADTPESCDEVMKLGKLHVTTLNLPGIDKLRDNFNQATEAANHLRYCHTNEKKRHKKMKGSLGTTATRRFWIDLGSREMDVTKNFDLRYPGASKFIKHTFEPNPKFVPLYEARSDITHHQVAVSTKNDSLQLSNADVGSSIVKNAAKNIAGPSVTVDTINWVNWLVRTVEPTDFVVVKMDIEFCEFAVLNLLLQSSAVTLIDELLLECHYKTRKSRKYIPAEGEEEPISRTDCKNLVHLIELSGVLAINWSKKNYYSDLYASSHGGFQAT
eukprot:TRINITY_DN25775_c0_g1_i1.p1 TRINITY_DN25775_c0_g1~~TRINITY_DN25775_c0_g1_i1.p1  ORF type:complete len:358 (+),score=74.35 TRINITY_DN25775_c0_g1_i1:51-1124(+)